MPQECTISWKIIVFKINGRTGQELQIDVTTGWWLHKGNTDIITKSWLRIDVSTEQIFPPACAQAQQWLYLALDQLIFR